jgi:hypothetical protein
LFFKCASSKRCCFAGKLPASAGACSVIEISYFGTD